MKNLFLICLFPLCVLAQKQQSKIFTDCDQDNKILVKGIDSVPGITAAELQSRAKYYIAQQGLRWNQDQNMMNFKIENPVVYSDSTVTTGHLRFAFDRMGSNVVDLAVKIEFKDEKYRYQFDRIQIIWVDMGKVLLGNGNTHQDIKDGGKNATISPILKKVKAGMDILEADLNRTMKEGVVKNEW